MGILTSFVGKGNIFFSGSSAEDFLASFNNSSSIHFRYDDYGYLSGSIEIFSNSIIADFKDDEIGLYSNLTFSDGIVSDYGLVSEVRDVTNDYGYISWENNKTYGTVNVQPYFHESITPAPHIGSGSFNIDGKGKESTTSDYVGSGPLFTFTSTTEAVCFNPPENTALFSINGKGKESTTPAPHIGSGSLFTFVSKTETVAVSPDDTKVLFSITGKVKESTTSDYVGSGSLFTFTSTTEAVCFNPPENIVLFDINGKGKESTTPAPHIGSGSLSISQKTKITTLDGKDRLISAYERFAPSITSTGSLIVSKINNITIFETGIAGKGRVKVIGAANESITPTTYIGSGSLFTFISKTETIAVSPDDTKVLFSITGSASNVRYIPEHTGSGFVNVDGSVSNVRYIPEHTGSGFVKISGKSKESITPAPHIGSGSFNIDGKGKESTTSDYVGSGSLFTFVSKTETVAVSPDDTKVLFSITGSASNVRYIPEYSGSGSLFTFTSTTETIAVSPDDTKALFSISGNLDESFAPAPHIGSGNLSIIQKTKITTFDGKERLVAAYESTSKSKLGSCSISITGSASNVRYIPEYSGFGSIFTFVSKAETIAVSPDDTKVLFSISGNLDESFAPAPHIGSGSFNVHGKGGESISPKPYAGSGFININGKGNESITPEPHIGSGSIFTFVSKTETIAISPDDTKVLFSINGSASNVRYVPEHTGSGSIFAINGATTSTFYDYKISQKAFKIISTTFESFSKSNYNGDLFTLLEGDSINQKIDYVPPKKSRLIVI